MKCIYSTVVNRYILPAKSGIWKTNVRPTAGTLRVAACAAGVALLVQTGHAGAQSSDRSAAAEQLFDQGRELMKAGDHEAACARFRDSLELERAAGAVLNLAVCYEKQGKLASAWSRYREVEDMDRRAGNHARARYARRAAAALEPRLPRLMIRAPGSHDNELRVTRNGMPVQRSLLGVSVYVDPGRHRIVAVAPGCEPFSVTVAAREGHESVVDIPAPRPGSATEGRPVRTSDGGAAGARRRPGAGIAITLGSTGVAAIAVGLGLGWSARSTWNSAFDDGLCNAATMQCTSAGQRRTDSARSRATLSTVVTGAGVAVTAAGAVLYLTAPRRERAVAVTPVIGEERWGLAASGRF